MRFWNLHYRLPYVFIVLRVPKNIFCEKCLKKHIKKIFHHYRAGLNHEITKIIISPESLHKLPENLKEPELLVIDETSSIDFNFQTTTVDQTPALSTKNLEMYEKLMKDSKRVVLMDAWLTNRCFDRNI